MLANHVFVFCRLDLLNGSSSMTSKQTNNHWTYLYYFQSEERTSSTHALTMYRYNYKIENKAYKVGKYHERLLKSP